MFFLPQKEMKRFKSFDQKTKESEHGSTDLPSLNLNTRQAFSKQESKRATPSLSRHNSPESSYQLIFSMLTK